jgi:sec-independent protein translocase protein TatA
MTTMLAFTSLGGPEVLIIALIGLLLFGSSQLPKLARSLGEARRELHEVAAADRSPD